MGRTPAKLRILIKTSLLVSNRQAPNVFLSYLAYSLCGILAAGIAIVPMVAPMSMDVQYFPLLFLLFVIMFDYFTIQTKLAATTLLDGSVLALFPLSRLRSIAVRFLLLLLDKRILFYTLPTLAVVAFLSIRGSIAQAVVMFLLFASFYLIMSESLFAVFPLLRKLANRFGARTATQIATLPIFVVIFLRTVIHLNRALIVHVPVASEFLKGSQNVIASNISGAMIQISYLILIALAFAVFFVAADSILARVGERLRISWPRDASEKGVAKVFFRASSTPIADAVEHDSGGALSSSHSTSTVVRAFAHLIFLDWKIHQKEERLLFVILVYPFFAVIYARSMIHQMHQPIASLVLPIFVLTQMIGIGLTENYFTRHGLRLKHVSILPMDPTKFVYGKSLSVWVLISGMNLISSVVLGYMFKLGYYQQVQGFTYSLFLPLVLVLTVNTLFLAFNRLSKHVFVSLVIELVVQFLASMIFVLLMLFNFAVGLMFVAGLFGVAHFFWMPAWGKKLSSEFQTLLEESK